MRPPKYGWAPGDYECLCINCGNAYIGDKRSISCEACAYKVDDLRAENERLKAVERHMDYCRSLLNCPTDDVLADRIKQIQEALKAAKAQLVGMESLFSQGVHFDMNDDFVSKEGCVGIAKDLNKALAKIEEAMGGKE